MQDKQQAIEISQIDQMTGSLYRQLYFVNVLVASHAERITELEKENKELKLQVEKLLSEIGGDSNESAS